MENKKAVPDFWAKEDWQAIWIGAIVIIIACFAVLTKAFDFSAIKFGHLVKTCQRLQQQR